jgi:signal transduction histidine kinase
MKRLIPGSIAGRTLAVLLLGLMISHVLSLGLYFADRTTALLLTGGEHVGDRVATIDRIVERTQPSERARVVALAQDPRLRISLTPDSRIDSEQADGWQTRILRTALETYLDPADKQNYRLRYGRPEAVSSALGAGYQDAQVVDVSLQLSDGNWLNFTALVYPRDPLLSLRFILSMVIMIVAILVLSGIVVYQMAAPLRAFAQAAQRLGTDVHAPPLPEGGPREVRYATRTFNEMQARIRRFVEDRTQMLAAISHDLRTPIMRLRLRAEFVEDDEQRERTLHDLDEMERMIASTLAFARDDAATEAPETVDLVALVQRVCDDIEDAGLSVEFEGEGRLAYMCRPNALRRALANLVENAALYGHQARVDLLAQERALVVRIDDQGPGIPEAEQENVFKPFQRLEASRSRETGGTGLGLTVARTIVRAHGGDIHLENRPEGGLRVEVTLPRQRN